LDAAQRQHEERSETLHAEQAVIEKRVQAEDERWEKERERLAAALRRARD
jgi:colicin import membrane protein